MDINEYKAELLERIKAGGPVSIVTSDDAILSSLELDVALRTDHIVPVCVQCSTNITPLDFWKKVFLEIWQALLPYMDEDFQEDEQDLYKHAQEADDTSVVSVNLELLLEEVKESLKLTVFLIFNHFDKLVDSQEEPDVMKVRGIASRAAVLTISEEPLETMTARKFNDKYFSNQFVTIIIE